MSVSFLLILSLAAALGDSMAKKYYADRGAGGASGGFVFYAVGSITAAVLLALSGLGAPSVFTVTLGVVFGTVTALQGITSISALQAGPMAYTSVIISFSTLISALSGVAFFGESLGLAQLAGILLMLVSFVLAANNGGGEKKANLKWLLLCLAAFLETGGIGVMQKIHQSSPHRDELNAFLVIAFVSSAVICASFATLLKKRETREREIVKEIKSKKRLLLMLAVMLVSGIGTAVSNKLNLYLSGVMDSAVFFPIVNGGGLVLNTLAAYVVFREKLSKKQWLGIASGIASVVFLCNPFS